MGKYLKIFQTSLINGFVYRLNFIMWRVRHVIQFLAVYFLWLAIYADNNQLFGYSRAAMLTYVIGTSVLRSFVLSSRSQTVGVEIASGDLNNYLVKPVSYLKNWLARDLSDKLLNLLFMTFELTLVILLLRPPLLPPASSPAAAIFIVAVILAMLLYFLFSFLVSSFAFWYPEHNSWPLRFFIFMILEFLAGGLFPLDIFPPVVYNFFRLLPPAFFLFQPMQIYLGRVDLAGAVGLVGANLVWLVLLYRVSRAVWRKGLKIYGAYGR